MSSRQLISHRLFVEAAGQDRREAPRPEREESRPGRLPGLATAVPLELIEAAAALPSESMPLRVSLEAETV